MMKITQFELNKDADGYHHCTVEVALPYYGNSIVVMGVGTSRRSFHAMSYAFEMVAKKAAYHATEMRELIGENT